jgi:hypothetical protein
MMLLSGCCPPRDYIAGGIKALVSFLLPHIVPLNKLSYIAGERGLTKGLARENSKGIGWRTVVWLQRLMIPVMIISKQGGRLLMPQQTSAELDSWYKPRNSWYVPRIIFGQNSFFDNTLSKYSPVNNALREYRYCSLDVKCSSHESRRWVES